MSETTELVRKTVAEVILRSDNDIDQPIVRSIGIQVAGCPKLDRLDISTKSIEPVAFIVAEAVYRIDLAEFGVSNSDQIRRQIVDEVTRRFASRTGANISDRAVDENSIGNSRKSIQKGENSRYETTEDDIIIADPEDTEPWPISFDDQDDSSSDYIQDDHNDGDQSSHDQSGDIIVANSGDP